MIDILSDERAKDRNEWIKIGWIINNISNGAHEGLDIWIKFSKRCSEQFKNGGKSICINEWRQMETKDLGIGTLKYMAKIDNHEQYDIIMKKYMAKYYIDDKDNIKNTHYDVASALLQKYGDEYICGSLEPKEVWYRFDKNVWREMSRGFEIYKKINVLAEDYTLINIELFKKSFQDKRFEQLSSECRKLINNLKTRPFKMNVMQEAKFLFYDEYFSRRLDKNNRLLAFKNGVYDLDTYTFRHGIPTDYLSTEMGVNFNIELHDSHPKVLKLKKYLEEVFTNDSVREYFINSSSFILVGGNEYKELPFWSGQAGNNGKSVTEELFKHVFGRYSINFPTTLITGKRTNSSAATPELVRLKYGARVGFFQEPEKHDVLNIGLLKELTGNDSIFIRGLYEKGEDIIPMFTPIVVCNEPPIMPYVDNAFLNRVTIYPFDSVFNKDAPDDYEEQKRTKHFKADPRLRDHVGEELGEAFIWLLIEEFKKGRKLPEPIEVKYATQNYKLRNNIYCQFIEENIVEDKKNVSFTSSEFYQAFKVWFSCNITGRQLEPKNDVITYIEKIWGKRDRKGRWFGRRLRTMDDESEDEDEDDATENKDEKVDNEVDNDDNDEDESEDEDNEEQE